MIELDPKLHTLGAFEAFVWLYYVVQYHRKINYPCEPRGCALKDVSTYYILMSVDFTLFHASWEILHADYILASKCCLRNSISGCLLRCDSRSKHRSSIFQSSTLCYCCG